MSFPSRTDAGYQAARSPDRALPTSWHPTAMADTRCDRRDRVVIGGECRASDACCGAASLLASNITRIESP